MVFSFHVYRKTAPNGKLSVYVGQRDYIDHLTHVDPIDGVVVLDRDYIGDRKIFAQVVLTYRYGREEDEVMGLTFAKELIVAKVQVYPQVEMEMPRTAIQQKLEKKLGADAVPFHLDLPQDCPTSVTLQQAREDEGKPCGVQWEIRVFIGEDPDDPPPRRYTVRLAIRRLQFAPVKQGRQPCSAAAKEFILSPGKLHLQVTLDRQIYYHGEPVIVTVKVTNTSTNKQVKKLKVSLIQLCDVSLGPSGQLRHSLQSFETQEGCPIPPNESLSRTVELLPEREEVRDKRGIALDGQLKQEDTSLASSTLFTKSDLREVFGVVVSYVVKVKLFLGALTGELTTEVPFTLMNPTPSTPPLETIKQDDEGLRLVIEDCQKFLHKDDESPNHTPERCTSEVAPSTSK